MALTPSTLGQLYSFFGLREDPFHISPNPRFYFSTPTHDSALAELLTGIQTRQGLMVLTGEAGTGKTTLIRQILEWLEINQRSSAFVFHTRLEAIELLEFILRDFGIVCSSCRKGDLISAFHQWLFARNAAGDSPVVILDEAQALSLGTMDDLRLFLNLENGDGKLLQIVLAGQLELDEKLRHPELQQLRQRVMIRSRLSPLSTEETFRYISSRLSVAGASDNGLFSWDTVRAIHACSRGVPRIVNLLCKEALVSAYASQKHAIAPECVYGLASELDLSVHPIVSSTPASFAAFAPVPPIADSKVDQDLASCVVDLYPETSAVARPENRSSRASAKANGVRSWTKVSASFFGYVGEISNSLLQDCRLLVRSLSPPSMLSLPPSSTGPRPPARKKALARISRWLRQPITPPDMTRVNRPIRQSSSKHL